MSKTIIAHEVKHEPSSIPETKIVEAYGLRKCPKLVEQVAGDDLEVRVNALSVLCKEFNNPYSISGCVQAGVVKVLSSMVTDPDYTTRERASLALAIAAKDANGLNAILEDNAVPDILKGRNDRSEVVRANVFECLVNVTRTPAGCEACNNAQVCAALVQSLKSESDALKPIILEGIYNIAGTEQGLVDALNCNAVAICVQLINKKDPCNVQTRCSAARTLSFLCFDERAKTAALENNVIAILVEHLGNRAAGPIDLYRYILNALMAITTTDLGKRQMDSEKIVADIVACVGDEDRILKLNTLKLLATSQYILISADYCPRTSS